MTGFGGMGTIDLDGKFDRAFRVFDKLKIVKRAASLGGIESLISLPMMTLQRGHTDEQLKAAGVTRGMLRLSCGARRCRRTRLRISIRHSRDRSHR